MATESTESRDIIKTCLNMRLDHQCGVTDPAAVLFNSSNLRSLKGTRPALAPELLSYNRFCEYSVSSVDSVAIYSFIN